MRQDARVAYNTNLAAEFWVLAALHRRGLEAHLTLGNKKSVDILIFRSPQDIVTVDVKGLAGPYDWPADNIRVLDDRRHIYVFLTFEGSIRDPLASPSVWIIPSDRLRPFIKPYATRTVVSRALVKANAADFKDAWNQLQSA